MKQDDVREDWEKKAVGKNVHTVYVYCYECKLWGVPMPLERICGNCNSKDTMTYYDRKTISILLFSHSTSLLQKMEQVIGEDDKNEDIANDKELQGFHDTRVFQRNKLRAEQRKALSDCIAMIKKEL